MENSLNLLKQRACNIQITLKDSKFSGIIDDIEEFIATNQIILVTLNRIDQRMKKSSEGKDYIVGLFDSIYLALEAFEFRLNEIGKQGKLVRFFTNKRLRKELDKMNSLICLQVSSLEQEWFPEELNPSPPKGSKTQTLSSDELWNSLFGNIFAITWDSFLNTLKKQISIKTISEEDALKSILDYSNTGTVNRFRFVEFLKGFGPLTQCLQKALKIVNEPWFYGYLSLEEAHKLLELHSIGTYLVRFSSSKPGSFGVDFVAIGVTSSQRYGSMPSPNASASNQETCVKSVLIEPVPSGFQIKQENQANLSSFSSLHDVLKHFQALLKVPLKSSLKKEKWFHGDVTSSEAEIWLKDQPFGTFLIRFSSQPGFYASSFVLDKGQIGKSLIKPMSNGGFQVQSDETDSTIYPTLQALVKSYELRGVFKTPFTTDMIKTRYGSIPVLSSVSEKTFQTPFLSQNIKNNKKPNNWNVDEVGKWLDSISLSELKPVFSQHKISGKVLFELTENDLKNELQIVLGHRKQLLKGIQQLKEQNSC